MNVKKDILLLNIYYSPEQVNTSTRSNTIFSLIYGVVIATIRLILVTGKRLQLVRNRG